MTILGTMVRGAREMRATVTLNNINLSNAFAEGGSRIGAGPGLVELVGARSATYEMLYRSQPMIRGVVDRIAWSIGRLPLPIYTAPTTDQARQRVREGPLYNLLERPFEGGSPFLLKQAIAFNLLVHGNAVAVRVRPRPGQPPTELIPSSWGQWFIKRGSSRPVDWYYWRNPWTGDVIPFLPDEVVHWRMWGGSDGVLGVSKLEALRTTLMNEDGAQRTIISAFERGGRPVGGVALDTSFRNEDAALRMRAQLQDAYGGADNAYKIMLLEGGAKWVNMSTNFSELEMPGLRKLNREEVSIVYNLPLTALGLGEKAAYASIVEQHLMEYQDTQQPYTNAIEETLQTQLIEPEPAFAGQYVEFNFKEILKGDPVKEIMTLTQATGRPVLTVNEARASLNLPRLGDVGGEFDTIAPMPNASLPAPASGGV